MLLLIALVSFAACRDLPPGAVPTSSPLADRPDLKVALVGALTGPNSGPANRALEGARLALDRVNADGDLPVGLVAYGVDTQEDPSTAADAVREEVVEDPEVVVAVTWASAPEGAEVRRQLQAARVPTVDLSPAGQASGDAGTEADVDMAGYRRLVASDQDQAMAAARVIDALALGRACTAGSTDARSVQLGRAVTHALTGRAIQTQGTLPVEPETGDMERLAAEIGASRCQVVFWSGGGADGAGLRGALDEAGGGDVRLVGGDAMRNDAFITRSGPSADGALSVCACVDVTSGSDLPLQAFIQEYQAKFGGPPGVYSAEGWDAGQIVIEAVRAGARTRADVADALDALTEVEGLARTYRFSSEGDLEPGGHDVSVSEVSAGQWVSLGPESKAVAVLRSRT